MPVIAAGLSSLHFARTMPAAMILLSMILTVSRTNNPAGVALPGGDRRDI